MTIKEVTCNNCNKKFSIELRKYYVFTKVGSFFNKIGAKIGSIKFVKLD